MDRFFTEIRTMLAREYGARLQTTDSAMGEVVIHKINKDFIPELTRRLEKEDDPSEREKLEQVIELWKEYGDKGNSLSRKWNTIATNEVADTFRSLDDTEAEDAAQNIAMMAWERDWIMQSGKFDPDQGPVALQKLWRGIIRRKSKDEFAKFIRTLDKSRKIPSTNDEGLDIVEQQPVIYTELEKMVNREVRVDLKRYVHQHSKYQVQEDIFDAWQELARDKGASRVNRAEDIYPTLAEKHKIKFNRLKEHWKVVKGLIMDYFKKELGLIVPTRVEKRLFRGSDEKSIANRIIAERYRMALAEWVLAPIMGREDA